MQDRVVIITGGGGGVGQVVTKRWLAEGARVLIAEARQDPIDALISCAGEHAGRIAGVAVDLTTEAGAAQMVAEAERIFGQPPDTLIHLVGAFRMGRLADADAPAIWNTMIAVNLNSAFYSYRAILPALRSRGGGWIVGLGARAALAPPARLAAYAASKAGLLALTQSLADEVKAEGIHVNLLLASTIDTPANRKAMGDAAAAAWVRPDDIADATLYLCSERAAAVYGATLEVYAQA